ncbi:MAG: sigma-70 family RNA polymerase sigma factor [Planctomycetes bacterium]|nr:sigma-70 family RNA polymerase sigma factor [Planctomycetota bacterium]
MTLMPIAGSSFSPGAAEETLQLTRRLSAGDEAAFRTFHHRYFDALYAFVLVICQGHVDGAQDVLQETLLRVARYARPIRDPDMFWRWLKMVARSAARDAARKEHRYLNLLRNYALRWLPIQPSEEDVAATELGDLLQAVLQKLAGTDRELVEGKYVHGASVRELATQTGLTERAVESRLLRLRRHLRARLLRELGRQ